MREIKFRGKSKLPAEDMKMLGIEHDNGWVYGYYVDGYIVGPVVESTEEYIALEWWCPVHRETVGQYTGLNDKNGREIYTGDIVRARHTSPLSGKKIVDHYKVTLARSTLYKMIHSSGQPRWNKLLFMHHERVELIGNIHDNPELMRS